MKGREMEIQKNPLSPSAITEAEILITSGTDYAAALKYNPGYTPIVLAKSKGRKAKTLIFNSQEMGIPIIEIIAFGEEIYRQLKIGEDIPENFYRATAQALALIYKSGSDPHPIRFVKPLKSRFRIRNISKESVETLFPHLAVASVSIEVGTSLYEKNHLFQDPLEKLRQKVAFEIGLALPGIIIRENPHLKPESYVIRLKENPHYEGTMEFPLETRDNLVPITNKIKQIISLHGHELIGYFEVEALLENLRKKNPGLIKEIFPRHLSIPSFRLILKNLLREQIPIRDLEGIMEGILDNISRAQDPDLLSEYVRISFARYLCYKYQDEAGCLNTLILSPDTEKIIVDSVIELPELRWLALKPYDGLRIITAIKESLDKVKPMGIDPVLLCSPTVRRFLRRIIEPILPSMPVLSYSEIVPLIDVKSVGMVDA